MQIKRRITGEVLYSDDNENMAKTLEAAIAAHADLRYANLKHADLFGANLRGVNFCNADLHHANLNVANLCDANLRHTNLCGASLDHAKLRNADLTHADLTCANLICADLTFAKMSWSSHDMISAVLMASAGESVARRKVAGLILVSRDWCWDEFIDLSDHDEFHWALDTLDARAKDDPDARQILRVRDAAKSDSLAESEG